MNLTPREMDKLLIFLVAQMAEQRRKRGLKLNYGETVALISSAIVEAARDGKTVAECMELGKQVVGPDDVLPGVRGMLKLMQVEATFDDGTKLVSCHDPVGGK
ncbi:urease subunit gamma [Streptosporangium sp. NBC_01755]|uniref:urease subunit gamma n=1 Tax=unclassified Streptosporangium TaxID=2632669 RepID=UPI002DDAA875|nr:MULTISPECIES: urease subunit gamma [unclassified Streptosporangium]WSA25051.1 urease subunit gamma [Streptosporangium sp. NBC_01810]WSD03618.1 urease subunit gamma [Streptosporangium sp. NBC_01755]